MDIFQSFGLTCSFSICVFLAPISTEAQEFDFQALSKLATEGAGPPGAGPGSKTVFVDYTLSDRVSVLTGCTSGKSDGLGEKIQSSLETAIAGYPASGLISWFLKAGVLRVAKSGVFTITKDKAVCWALVHEPNVLRKSSGSYGNGSIFTTSWQGGKIVDARTDSRFCKTINKNFLCYEVTQSPQGFTDEVDAVSGCFQMEVSGQLRSMSFGRGNSLPDHVASTFSPSESISSEGCVTRGLGQDIKG
ncbi:hypothetical protein [Puniceibacterium sediminis]|uniref:Uncharacterized protein n=1 Tax=Puniceibacterium sediminis TaxID=1608407 RepID=A0A238UXL8_9RHOB|nr:hypothetical protein [Puniceibacterium sediminis]SNR26009.1 hypothetical protein SAMN06265370_101179 [Puniceibacterium sediminis]